MSNYEITELKALIKGLAAGRAENARRIEELLEQSGRAYNDGKIESYDEGYASGYADGRREGLDDNPDHHAS